MKNHTKTIIAVIIGITILIGGGWLINESRYPNAPAFDDYILTIRGYCAKYLVNVDFMYIGASSG
ncbi:hypothetical protein KM918_04080 [Priestia megaterium]|uniref:hypothetical protein n=1 Tax=Priestia megaterium TaxID=1404 RepID=UPI001C21D43C|nr:hypothetical protein [Priestia megaterium]MBU8686526.1 hypothetical protein [Priestia megaterium]